MDRRITVRAVVIDSDGRLLCVRHKPYGEEQDRDYWCTPGGGLDPGEDLLTGLEREMIEETGVKPQIGTLLYMQQYRDEKREYLEFFYEVTNATDYQNIDLSQTSHGVEEIAVIEFIDPSAVDRMLPQFLSEVSLRSDAAAGKTQYFNNL